MKVHELKEMYPVVYSVFWAAEIGRKPFKKETRESGHDYFRRVGEELKRRQKGET